MRLPSMPWIGHTDTIVPPRQGAPDRGHPFSMPGLFCKIACRRFVAKVWERIATANSWDFLMKRPPKRPRPLNRPSGSGSPRPLPPSQRPRVVEEDDEPIRPSARPARGADARRGPAARSPRGPSPGRGDREGVPTGPAVVAPPDVLARAAVEIATAIEPAVYEGGKRADRELAVQLKRRRDLGPADGQQISAAVFALFRWRGWIEPLGPLPIAERLMLSLLLDEPRISPIARVLAHWNGWAPSRLMALGDAPDWKACSEGFRRLLGAYAVTADPWRLFPPFLRDHLPIPPGAASVKFRHMELLQVLQKRPPLWVRAQGAEPETVWKALRAAGAKPWIHRRIKEAARLGPEVDVYHLPPFEKGHLEIQDLASQVVGIVCDPDPGDRWWDACTGAGGKALHLASQMSGRGVVVATDRHEGRLKDAVRRARRSPFRNITTKVWDGSGVAGKPGSFDGVLVDAPCSGIGTWRRNPDARWSLTREAIPRLAAQQAALLDAASAGVRVGGTLVYSVCTLTPTETRGVVLGFLERHPNFKLDPFPDPFGGDETDGTLLVWPQDQNTDGMYVARMVRTS